MAPTSSVTLLPVRRPTTASNPPSNHPSFDNSHGLSTILKARFSPSRNFVPIPSTRDELVQVCKPDFGASVLGGLKATWIGHASFLVETSTLLSNKAGPYRMVGPTRFLPTPCSLQDLPEIDVVLISHDHHYYLDSNTIKKIHAKSKGHVRFFCGLGVKMCLLGLGVGLKPEEVMELDWWDGVQLSVEGVSSVNLVCTPAQHRSGRAGWNFQVTLWCSWVIEKIPNGVEGLQLADASSTSSDTNVYVRDMYIIDNFVGGTAYCAVAKDEEPSHLNSSVPPCPAFAEIGDLYGSFDLALLPISCYSSRSFISSVHSSPENSISCTKTSVPPKRWKKACEEQGLTWGEDIGVCDIGETVAV
ncbi:uncharacterized protein K441DRAFT_706089 [Cenococcum geophilum 1.58]|uniref:uncharacterized protein n=1 Tax=Cenococcum geophilum 1.58 TaxID=794803 RepID=UPI00358F1C7B|nr:hypothetical protein K441DRAFT_706089 [Cenococcum geophilum 1.58]